MREKLAAVLLAVMLVTAGCSGFGGDAGPGDSGEPSDGTSGDATGTVTFYISDQQNAIDDFEHLNVTVSTVGFVPADANGTDADGNGTDAGNETDTGSDDGEAGPVEFEVDDRTVDLTELKGANATVLDEYEVPNGTYEQAYIEVSAVNGTLTDGSSADVKLPSGKLRLNQEFTVGNNESVDFVYDVSVVKRGNSGSYNIRPVASESGTDQEIRNVDADEAAGDGDDGADGAEDEETATETTDAQQSLGTVDFWVSDEENAIGDFEHLNVTVSQVGFQRGGESGNWTEFDVDNRTMDLTELQGANATQLDSFQVRNGTYTKVFIHVSEVNGTLTDGSSPDVKLPSSKLQLNEEFEVGANESVDFVYDITVVKRGNSGSYNVKPVASESGTDQEIRNVDEDDEEPETGDGEGTTDGEETNESDAAALNATFVGNVTRGENVTVQVTRNGSAVENATARYDGTTAATDADGNVTFAVPADAEEVEVEVEYEGESVTLKETFEPTAEESDGSTAEGDSGSEEPTATATPTATPTATATG